MRTMRGPATAVGSLGFGRLRRLAAATGLALVLVVLSQSIAGAHGGDGPRIEVVPNRVSAGDTVWLHGEDLEPLAVVRVDLLTAAGDEPILQVKADHEGHLVESLIVPVDLVPRIYELRATDGAGTAVSTYLTVEAAPANAGGDSAAASSASVLALGGLVAMAAAVFLVAVLLRRRGQPRTH
jgi:hypothetical protein